MTTSQGRDSRGGDSRGGGRPQTRRFSGGRRRRQCVCKEVGHIDYKDISVLRRFISDRGRIESGRKAGNCAKCQRELSHAISRARHLALLPFAPNHLRVTGSISPTASADSSEDEEDTGTDEDSGDETTDSEEPGAVEDSVESSEDESSEDEEDSSDDEDSEDETTDSEESSAVEDDVESSEDDSSDDEDDSSDDDDSDETDEDRS